MRILASFYGSWGMLFPILAVQVVLFGHSVGLAAYAPRSSDIYVICVSTCCFNAVTLGLNITSISFDVCL